MAELSVFDLERNEVGTISLSPEVFEAPVKEHLLYYVVNWQLAKRRSGTASTKTRGEVKGGSKKPWRQKGTGRARAGTATSPIWRTGGVVFGPKPKDWSFKLPKKVRRAALISALSFKSGEERVIVVKEFALPEIKTKQLSLFLNKFELKKALIVISDDNVNLSKSAKNLKAVKVLKIDGLNVYDILRFDNIVFTESSIKRLEEGFVN